MVLGYSELTEDSLSTYGQMLMLRYSQKIRFGGLAPVVTMAIKPPRASWMRSWHSTEPMCSRLA